MKDPAEYISDTSVWGMIHALTIRSPIARGVLKEIKCPQLPEEYQLITAEQIPGENQLAEFPVTVLADNELSYIGQPVAILAGPEESVLEEIASNIVIDAEEKEPGFSGKVYDGKNKIVSRDLISGDPDQALCKGGVIVNGTYVTEIQEHWYPEPHGALAVPSSFIFSGKDRKNEKAGNPKPRLQVGKGRKTESFTIYTATQWPFHIRRSVSKVLGLEDEKITITPTLMTMHLDGKIWYPSLVACHAALAAFITKSPVRLMLTREEDFLYSPKRNKAEIQVCSALEENGSISASIIQVQLELGAEGVFENEMIDFTCLGTLGAYKHGSYKLDAAGVCTNIPPQGPMAGFGLSQGFFAAERHISRIADFMGQDPAEWRKKNFLKKDQNLAIGLPLKDTVPLAELIDAAAAASDYYRKWASYELLRNRRRGEKWEFAGVPLRGIGISTAFQGNGFLYGDKTGNAGYSVEVTLEKNGSLEIKTSIISSASGHLDTWQNLAQEILGVDPSLVRLTSNTTEAPDSGPGTLSRNISSITGLVESCCKAIREQRFHDPLPITVRRSISAGKTPGWVPEREIDPGAFACPGWGAAVAEIEIDPVSLEPVTRGIWMVVDGGKILNESRARRTLKTGIIQALGWTCREQIRYEEGKIAVENYRNYDILAPEEMPPITVDFFPGNSKSYKGIGELPFSCVPAAYVQAVSQAMDHHFKKIPLNGWDIWETWKRKKTEPAK